MKIAFKKKGKGLLGIVSSWLINIWTIGKYSHCEIVNTNNSYDMKDWSNYSATALENGGGVTSTRGTQYNPESWDIFEVVGEGNEEVALEFLEKQVGKKYDWTGIFLSMIFNTSQHEPNRWFCSEIVAEALVRGDYLVTDIKSQSLHPNRLAKLLIEKDIILIQGQ